MTNTRKNKNSKKQASKVQHVDTKWKEQKENVTDQTIEFNNENGNVRLENQSTCQTHRQNILC